MAMTGGRGLAQGLAQRPRGRQPIHHGHLHVHQHRINQVRAIEHRLHALGAVVGHADLGTFAFQQLAGHLAVVGVVFHQQQAPARQAQRGGQGLQGHGGAGIGVVDIGFAQREVEPEGAALAGFAAHPDLTAHQRDQAAADGQAQAGATVFAGGRAFGLREALEDAPERLGTHADPGVAHRDAQAHLFVVV